MARFRRIEKDDEGNDVLLANDADVAEMMKALPSGVRLGPVARAAIKKHRKAQAERRRNPDRRASA